MYGEAAQIGRPSRGVGCDRWKRKDDAHVQTFAPEPSCSPKVEAERPTLSADNPADRRGRQGRPRATTRFQKCIVKDFDVQPMIGAQSLNSIVIVFAGIFSEITTSALKPLKLPPSLHC